MRPLVLASGSPIRRRMLANAGLAFEVVPARVDEVLPDDTHAEDAAVALALLKAHEVHSRRRDAVVMGSDQVLELPDGTLGGKTATLPEARARLRELSGKWHAFVCAAAVVADGMETVVVERAEVLFHALSDNEIERVLSWQEWQGSAGSYRYESKGINLVAQLRGDFFTVLGLPLHSLLASLRAHGVLGIIPGTQNSSA